MSSPLAIGAVTAVLRDLLDNGVVGGLGGALGSPVLVSAVAPDRIDLDEAEPAPRLNLFLHRVSPNPGWRNADLPARDADGRRSAAPPLALDLHYLVTAYGFDDFQAEILLGYAMHLLHERPVLDRAAIRRALEPSPLGPPILPPAFQALSAADLADQVEAVTVTLEPVDTEEMARLWSATQAVYRPSAAYLVSVVLIEAARPTRAPLPVLSRGPVDPVSGRDSGVVVAPSVLSPYPAVDAVEAPARQAAARLGDTVTVHGRHLDGTRITARLTHRLGRHEIPAGPGSGPAQVIVPLPATESADRPWPAGVWHVVVSLVPPGESAPRETDAAVLLLAPTLELPSAHLQRDPGTGRVAVRIGVSPRVHPAQDCRLTIGVSAAPAEPRTEPASVLHFDFPSLPGGRQRVRLRVDGVESLLVDRSTTPPSFVASQFVSVPP